MNGKQTFVPNALVGLERWRAEGRVDLVLLRFIVIDGRLDDGPLTFGTCIGPKSRKVEEISRISGRNNLFLVKRSCYMGDLRKAKLNEEDIQKKRLYAKTL